MGSYIDLGHYIDGQLAGMLLLAAVIWAWLIVVPLRKLRRAQAIAAIRRERSHHADPGGPTVVVRVARSHGWGPSLYEDGNQPPLHIVRPRDPRSAD